MIYSFYKFTHSYIIIKDFNSVCRRVGLHEWSSLMVSIYKSVNFLMTAELRPLFYLLLCWKRMDIFSIEHSIKKDRIVFSIKEYKMISIHGVTPEACPSICNLHSQRSSNPTATSKAYSKGIETMSYTASVTINSRNKLFASMLSSLCS